MIDKFCYLFEVRKFAKFSYHFLVLCVYWRSLSCNNWRY